MWVSRADNSRAYNYLLRGFKRLLDVLGSH
jgi:hypothetical protein